jgi:hypothetical protein
MKAARTPLLCLALVGGLVACGGKVIFDTGGAGAGMGSGGAHTTTVGNTMTTVNGTTNGTTVGKGATGNVTISSSVYAVSTATGVTTGSGCMPAPVVVPGEHAEVACFNWSKPPCPAIDNPALAGALTTLIDTGKSGCAAEKVVNVACTDQSMAGSGCCYVVIAQSPCSGGG